MIFKNFILYNKIPEYIIIALLIINTFFLIVNLLKNNEIKNHKNNKIEKFIIFILVFLIILISLFIILKKVMITIILIYLPFLSLIKILKDVYSKNSDENNYNLYIILSSYIFLIFFSSTSIRYYTNFTIISINCFYIEILHIFFYIFKIILFSFTLLTNFTLLIKNISIFFSIDEKKLLIKNNKKYSINFLDYEFENNNTIVAKLINYIKCAFHYLKVFIKLAIISLLIIIEKIKNFFINILIIGIKNNNKFIRKAINISIIIALTSTYIIIKNPNNTYNNYIVDIYTFISTAILIPIIIDLIKEK